MHEIKIFTLDLGKWHWIENDCRDGFYLQYTSGIYWLYPVYNKVIIPNIAVGIN